MATLPFGWPCGATFPGFSPGAPARRLRRRRLRGCRLSGVMRTHKNNDPYVFARPSRLAGKPTIRAEKTILWNARRGCLTEIVARKVRDVVWGRFFLNASGEWGVGG